MTAPPRDVGSIEGREVVRDPSDAGDAPRSGRPAGLSPSPPSPPSSAPPPPPPATPSAPSPSGELVVADPSPSVWQEIRRSRGRNVPNSRPLPEWVRRFSWVLDDAFLVPGTAGRRVGVDGLISIVPVAGDAVGVGLSLVIVVVGVGAGVSIPTLLRMLLNIGVEALIGLVPLAGVVFNMAFKANNRNVALIEADLENRRRTRRSSLAVLVLTLGVIAIGAVMLVVLAVLGIAVLIWVLSQLF